MGGGKRTRYNTIKGKGDKGGGSDTLFLSVTRSLSQSIPGPYDTSKKYTFVRGHNGGNQVTTWKVVFNDIYVERSKASLYSRDMVHRRVEFRALSGGTQHGPRHPCNLLRVQVCKQTKGSFGRVYRYIPGVFLLGVPNLPKCGVPVSS